MAVTGDVTLPPRGAGGGAPVWRAGFGTNRVPDLVATQVMPAITKGTGGSEAVVRQVGEP